MASSSQRLPSADEGEKVSGSVLMVLIGGPTMGKRTSQIEKAVQSIDAEIAVLMHARKKLVEQMDAATKKKQPRLKAVADAS